MRPLNAGPQTTAGRALKEEVEERAGFEVGSNFNFDALARFNVSVDDVMDRIEETPEAHAAVDEHNARLDSIGSFSAGVGDAVWFWCPGCGSYARSQWGIESGDADRWSYTVGSVTGIVGSVAMPHPTAAARPSRSDIEMELRSSLRDVNPTMCKTNCGYTAIATDSTLAGGSSSAIYSRSGLSVDALESYFGRKFTGEIGVQEMINTVKSWGPGTRGVVVGFPGTENLGHAFNVVNRDGMVFFIDGQSWYSRVRIQSWDRFQIMQTK